jgi:hypothetical protein
MVQKTTTRSASAEIFIYVSYFKSFWSSDDVLLVKSVNIPLFVCVCVSLIRSTTEVAAVRKEIIKHAHHLISPLKGSSQ